MKTLEEMKTYDFQAIDGRDKYRLAEFIPENQLTDFGMELKEESIGQHITIPFNRENILERLKSDVAFGFEKALNQRGISASLMFHVVKMWNDILDDSGSEVTYNEE